MIVESDAQLHEQLDHELYHPKLLCATLTCNFVSLANIFFFFCQKFRIVLYFLTCKYREELKEKKTELDSSKGVLSRRTAWILFKLIATGGVSHISWISKVKRIYKEYLNQLVDLILLSLETRQEVPKKHNKKYKNSN